MFEHGSREAVKTWKGGAGTRAQQSRREHAIVTADGSFLSELA